MALWTFLCAALSISGVLRASEPLKQSECLLVPTLQELIVQQCIVAGGTSLLSAPLPQVSYDQLHYVELALAFELRDVLMPDDAFDINSFPGAILSHLLNVFLSGCDFGSVLLVRFLRQPSSKHESPSRSSMKLSSTLASSLQARLDEVVSHKTIEERAEIGEQFLMTIHTYFVPGTIGFELFHADVLVALWSEIPRVRVVALLLVEYPIDMDVTHALCLFRHATVQAFNLLWPIFMSKTLKTRQKRAAVKNAGAQLGELRALRPFASRKNGMSQLQVLSDNSLWDVASTAEESSFFHLLFSQPVVTAFVAMEGLVLGSNNVARANIEDAIQLEALSSDFSSVCHSIGTVLKIMELGVQQKTYITEALIETIKPESASFCDINFLLLPVLTNSTPPSSSSTIRFDARQALGTAFNHNDGLNDVDTHQGLSSIQLGRATDRLCVSIVNDQLEVQGPKNRQETAQVLIDIVNMPPSLISFKRKMTRVAVRLNFPGRLIAFESEMTRLTVKLEFPWRRIIITCPQFGKPKHLVSLSDADLHALFAGKELAIFHGPNFSPPRLQFVVPPDHRLTSPDSAALLVESTLKTHTKSYQSSTSSSEANESSNSFISDGDGEAKSSEQSNSNEIHEESSTEDADFEHQDSNADGEDMDTDDGGVDSEADNEDEGEASKSEEAETTGEAESTDTKEGVTTREDDTLESQASRESAQVGDEGSEITEEEGTNSDNSGGQPADTTDDGKNSEIEGESVVVKMEAGQGDTLRGGLADQQNLSALSYCKDTCDPRVGTLIFMGIMFAVFLAIGITICVLGALNRL